ncbi:hypothetical protein MtrunA17_Chr2g0308231 [Medicago truncatula]|uniref:Uncharacterized protein n=1 Tax=Medicago truncatula TaxID=3880 RepID=A0A396JCX3_MEDTR|nr:hypothetical protein MtrunA17_Chr2g0308231 [Medicago truncatula]
MVHQSRTRIWERRLEMLENGMVFIVLITRISLSPPIFPTTNTFFQNQFRPTRSKSFCTIVFLVILVKIKSSRSSYI